MQENLILAYYAQIWKFGPGPPKMEFFKNFSFLWKGLQISLLTSPQPPPDIKLGQVMQENVILAYYARIWNSGPRLPKMEFFKKFSFFCKGLQISLLTSPQPPADIKFKTSYARKHIIKKVESRTQLLNPEQGEISPLLKGSMIVLIIIYGIFKWYALHYIFVRWSLRVSSIILSIIDVTGSFTLLDDAFLTIDNAFYSPLHPPRTDLD